MNSGTKVMIISLLLAIACPVILGQVDPSCNYAQNMDVGATYYVYNQEYEYSNNYGPQNRECRWVLNAPENYNIVFSCTLVMPVGNNCNIDQLEVFLNGRTNLDGSADYIFCGNYSYPFSAIESSISLIIDLKTSQYTTGGHFLCEIKSKARSPQSCDCGYRDTRRIVGGIETEPNEFPMMAAIIDLQKQDVLCGATIIAEYYVVTAAHCVKYYTVGNIALLIGAHDLTSEEGKLMQINNIIIHYLYDPNNDKGDYDIAVLRTQAPMVSDDRTLVAPVCLPFRYSGNSFANEQVTVIGWGTKEFTGEKSEVLLETDLNVLSEQECYDRADGADQTKMCTFRKGHDSCQSDSGGPVLWKDSNGRSQLVGVISYGRGCASDYYPGVNTRVTAYLPWIQSVTPEVVYCVK